MNPLSQTGARLLRLLPAEPAHEAAIAALQLGLGPKRAPILDPVLACEIAGLKLSAPVGLAAGFDKNAVVAAQMANYGFGWVECGTVTPRPQPGNPRPRLFRLTSDKAVINRMGFNNCGLAAFKANLQKQKDAKCPVGANIGANKDSEDRIGDYVQGLRALWGLPDWFTINISSPNTPGLRELQGAQALDDLLGRIMDVRAELTGDQPSAPIFLKVAPDLDEHQIDDIANAARTHGLSGLIISNTTLARPDSLVSKYREETGGLSGGPLFAASTKVLKLFAQATKGNMPLIGVGGIGNADQALAKLRAGASALQMYSALVFGGPELVMKIHQDMAKKLHAAGIRSLGELVGADLV